MHSKRSSAGFTLIELMVSVVVLAILATIGLPAFNDLISSQRARAATSALHDSLSLGRSEAIKRNASTTLKTSNLADGWTIETVAAPAIVLRREEGSRGVTFSPADPSVVFNRFGRLETNTKPNITVTTAGSSIVRCLSIESTGRAKIRDGAC
jgi:type IV fimbrial biogenesis protein FimT